MAEVPAGVVTVTSTVPVPAGLSAVIVVSLTTVTFVAARRRSRPPWPVKLVPVIVTDVPPAAGPLLGLRPVTVGAWRRVSELDRRTMSADVPAGVVTVTSTTPVPAGLSAVIVVSLTTVEIRRRRRAEVDRRGAGEAGAGDRHRGAAGREPLVGAHARDRRRSGHV